MNRSVNKDLLYLPIYTSIIVSYLWTMLEDISISVYIDGVGRLCLVKVLH